jgi:hypothetical protein
VPAVGGIQVHVSVVLHSWPTVHAVPSHTKNLYLYGLSPPAAAAVQITGDPAVTDDAFGITLVRVSWALGKPNLLNHIRAAKAEPKRNFRRVALPRTHGLRAALKR